MYRDLLIDAKSQLKRSIYSLHEGGNSLTCAEVNHAPGSYVYTMGILYGANFNMADRTAGQLESTLRVSNACAKAFEARTS